MNGEAQSTSGTPKNFVLSNVPLPEPEQTAPEKENGLKRMWNRRFKSVMVWFVLCIGLLVAERYLTIDKELVKLMIEKSTWVLGLLIVGLSGTNLMHDWIQKYK